MKVPFGKSALLLGAALLTSMLPAAEDQVWKFPLAKNQRRVTLTVPDWGKEGFSAEVWCKPESTDCGYAILIRRSFGFPNFFGEKDYDNYLFTADGKNTAGRVYTKLEPGRYHYYAMTGTPTESVSYRDGKPMRTNKAPGIPDYNGSPMYVGNSIGWCKKNFEGEIALIRIYNRALAPEEIAEHNRLLRENKKLPKSEGLIFEADRRGLLPENAGQTVTEKLDNRSVDKIANPPSRHVAGKPEKEPALVGFEDLSGWTMTYVAGEIEPVITRSREEPLWGEYVLRAEFKRGPLVKSTTKVVLAPPEPIRITDDFDAVNIWRFATTYRGDNRPKLKYSIQYRTADGKLHSTGYMGGWLEHGWGIHHHTLPRVVKAPAEFVSITFEQFNEPVKVAYLDALRFYKRSDAALPDAAVPSWQSLGVPVRSETIMPEAPLPGKVTLAESGKNVWRFTSVNSAGEKLEYTIAPAKGTFDDITATYRGRTFHPMAGGGIWFAADDVYPVKAASLLAPNSPAVKRAFLGGKAAGDKLVLRWEYQVPNRGKVRSDWVLEVKDNTLMLSLSTDSGAAGELRVGSLTGVSGKVVEVPYLNLGAWIHPTYPPGIFASKDLYVSVFADWYNSDASGLFGESSARPGGHFELKADTSDHRWVPDPGAADPTDVVRDVSILNGGSYYWPTTAGKRNPLRERVMVTVNRTLASVLPTIPNPKLNKYLELTKNAVWATRMWYAAKLPLPDYFDRELAMWKLCKAYGMDHIFMRFHGTVNRMYTPRRNGDPATFIKSFTEPGIGGDVKLAEFIKEMKKLGFRTGLYTDHMLLSQLSYDAWDEDMLNLDSNSQWLYSSGMSKQTKISRMIALQKKFNGYMRETFAPDCAYLDQITCPPPWRYTDYDARTPDAGKFSAPYRVFMASLRQEEADFGPVLSEGKTQMFFAGLCDSYAQPQRMKMNVLPDFNLRKIHLLSNDCGYELTLINWKAAGLKPAVGVYRNLALQYIYGNTAHIYGPYHGEPYDKALPDFVIRSYFLIQPLQEFYALVPVRDILYNVNGALKPVEDAIASGTLDRNQVKITYQNGLEVAANLHAKDNFKVKLHDREYFLPPDGFAAFLPGHAEAFSALIDGARSDFMSVASLEYRDGNADMGAIRAKHAYILKKSDKVLVLTPAPFQAAENVVLDLTRLPGWEKTAEITVEAQDIAGKSLGRNTLSAKGGKAELAVDGKAFRYRITR